jgi:hypothetical protein
MTTQVAAVQAMPAKLVSGRDRTTSTKTAWKGDVPGEYREGHPDESQRPVLAGGIDRTGELPHNNYRSEYLDARVKPKAGQCHRTRCHRGGSHHDHPDNVPAKSQVLEGDTTSQQRRTDIGHRSSHPFTFTRVGGR